MTLLLSGPEAWAWCRLQGGGRGEEEGGEEGGGKEGGGEGGIEGVWIIVKLCSKHLAHDFAVAHTEW